MRAANRLSLVLFGCLVLIITPAMTPGQFQPGGGKGSGGKGGGKGGFDPNAMFDRMANGRAAIPVDEVRTSRRTELMQYMKDRGITNGQITRQQYVDFIEQVTSGKLTASPAGSPVPAPGGPGGGKGQGMFMIPGGGAGGPIDFNGGFSGKKKFGGEFGGPQVALSPEVINQSADMEFKKRDVNGDGKLNLEEMGGQLRSQLDRWDKNRDGFISLEEFREYYAARFTGGGEDQNAKGVASIIIDEEELDRKAVVFRIGGKMPAGLPGWFKELDYNSDGQVELWEWRKGGKSIEDFATWDLNDDGVITPEEALRIQTTIARNTSKSEGGTLSDGDENGFGNKGKKKGDKGGFGGFGGFGGKDNGGMPAFGPGGGGGGGNPWAGGSNPWGGQGGKKGKKGGN